MKEFIIVLKVKYDRDIFTKQQLLDSLPLVGVFNNSFTQTEVLALEGIGKDEK